MKQKTNTTPKLISQKILGILLLVFGIGQTLLGQTSGDYRSIASGNWNNAAIWETYDGTNWVAAATSPSSSNEVIVIQTGHYVTINSGVSADQLVVASGATLDISNQLIIVDGIGIDLYVDGTLIENSNLSGNGLIQINSGGNYNWVSGNFDFGGVFNINSGASMDITGGGKYFTNSATINNYATCTWSGTGGIYMYYGAPTFNNYGTMQLNTDAGFYNYYVGGFNFNNQVGGLVNKVGSAGEFTFASNCNYNNYGTMQVSTGGITFQGTGNNYGVFNTTTGSNFNISSGNCHSMTGSSYTGTGNVNVSGGTFSIDGPSTATGCAFNCSSGSIAGGSVMNFNTASTFNWAGSNFDVSGTINVNSDATMGITGGSKFNYNSGVINNYTTCTWTGGGVYLYYGAPTFNNYGTLLLNSDAGFYNYYVGGFNFNNQLGGLVNKIGSAGEFTFASNCNYNNYGTMQVSTGGITFQGTGYNNAIFNTTTGSNFNISGGNCHSMTGSTYTGTGNVNVSGGTFSIDGQSTATGCTFNFSGGSIAGGSVFDFNTASTFNWAGSNFDVSGTINVNSGAAMAITGGSKFNYNNGVINNYTTCTWTGGGVYLYYGAPTFNNYGTLLLNSDAGFYNYYVGGYYFNNQLGGLVNKVGSAGEFTFASNCNYNNDGTIQVSTGGITFQGTGYNNAVFNTTTGSNFNISSGNCHSMTGSTYTGTGNVNVSGGTFSIDGPSTATGCTFNCSAGSIFGSSVMNFNTGSTFNWGSSNFDLSGTINVNSDATMGMTGGNRYCYNSGVINNYTTCTWTGGGVYLYYGAPTFNNYGTMLLNSDAGFYNYYIGGFNFNNQSSGTINKTGGTGEFSFASNCAFNNAGNTTINTGVLSFYNSPNPHSGNYSIASGAQLYSPLTVSFTGSSFTNNGNVSLSNLVFNGSSNQILSGTGNINYLAFNSPSGVALTGTQTVNSGLALNSGLVTMGNNDLIVGASASFTGGSSSSYFVTNGTGSLKRRVFGNNTNVLFPIGTLNSYMPANVLLDGSSTADNFSARVINQLNFNYDNSNSPYGAAVTANVVGKTWVIKEDLTGGSNATVSLQWNSGDELTAFNRSNAAIYNYDGTYWQHNAFTTASGSNPYSISKSGITSFREFAVSDDLSTLNFILTCTNNYYTVCNGSTFNIPFVATGSFDAGNVFTAELSDSSGSFSIPVVLGSISSTSSGIISGTIPPASPDGTNYRLRITSSNPALTSVDNGSAITISTSSTNVFYQDNDGDGYGNPSVSLTSCSTPAGYVVDNTDCNDDNNAIHTPPIVSLTVSPATTVCAGTSITLSGTGATSYNWTGGVTNGIAFNASSSGTYTVTGTTMGCFNTAVTSITVNPLPVVSSSATLQTLCSGTPTTLSASGASSYNWLPGNLSGASVSATPLSSLTYTVLGTDANGCTNTSTQFITVNTTPTVGATITPSSTICEGTSITLMGTGAATYTWNGGVNDSVAFTPASNGGASGISTNNSSLFVGLRKLVNSYNGPALQLRRDNDNATMDFGFVGNDLDVVAINTWLAGSSAHCTTIYDQSGNGRNVTQGNSSQQPVFVANGLNGRPILHFNAGQIMGNTSNFPAPFTVVCAAKQTGPTRGRMLSSYYNNWLLGWWGGYKSCAHFDGWVLYPSIISDNNPYIYTGTSNGSSAQVYENGTLISNLGGGYPGPNGITLGGSGNYGEYSDCDFMDVMIFSSVLPNADRSAVESNIANYYALPNANNTVTYTVTGTAANGCSSSYTQTVTVNPKPTVSAIATPDSIICVGNSVTLSGAGANTYLWTGGVTNAQAFSPASTATYTVIGTDGNGCANTAIKTVIVNSSFNVVPTATATTICAGSLTTLSATGATTYNWMPGGMTGSSVSVSPTLTTTYTVTGYNGSGCYSTATILISVNPLPVIGYTSPSSINVCNGTSVTLNGTGAISYSWSNGITNGVPFTPLSTTTYTVTGTDANTCNNTTTARVTVGGNYTLSTSSTSVNCGQSDGSATVSVSGGNIGSGSGLLSYAATSTWNSYYGGLETSLVNDNNFGTGVLWNPTSSPFEMTMTFANEVRLDSVKIKGGQFNGNYNIPDLMKLYRGTSSGTLLSTVVPTYDYSNYSIPNNGTSQIYTWVITPNSGYSYSSIMEITCYGSTETYTYQWSANANNQTTPTATALNVGTFTVNVTDANGCSQSTSQNVVSANPISISSIVSPTNATVCEGQSVSLSGQGGTTYSWSGGVTNGIPFTPTTTTTYTVTGTDEAGCSGTATQTITVNPIPTINVSATSLTVCVGSSTTLSATGALTYTWMPGNLTGASITVNPNIATTYTVTGTTASGCTNSATITINVNSLPSVSITPSGSTNFCIGGSVTLDAGAGYNSYAWSTGATTRTVNVTSANYYTVTVTNSNGCANSTNIFVNVVANPTVIANSDSPVCSGTPLHLTASGGVSYQWNGPNSYSSTTQNPIFNSASTVLNGTYTVTATNSTGCSATATTVVAVNANHAPVLSYTGNGGFVTNVVNPANGLPTALYRFEVRYTDADGDLPANTYPRLQLDFEGNGSLTDANDRLLYMIPVNPNDNDVTDGKDYYYNAAALPEGTSWQTTIVADDQTCSVTFGSFNEPDVQRDVDISIFANDISFSNSHPNPGDQITVFATIHNYSGRIANNFTAHLRNQFDTTVVYPDITVSSLSSLPNNNSVQVSWTITTPALPAWCPMQVFVDYGNALAEPNELDNQAIRPFTNGHYTLPGHIELTAAPSPSLVPSSAGVSIYGHAHYVGTAVVLANPSCAGATITGTCVETGQQVSTYTNSNGDYSFGITAPVTAGTYHVNVHATDYTLEGDTATTFDVYFYTPPVCVAPDIITSVSLSPSTVSIPNYNCTAILAGQSLTGTATVTNAGNAPSAATSTLQITLPDGTLVPGPFTIPALAIGQSVNFNLPAMTFSYPVSTYINASADVANVVSECNEGNNSANACILVLPPLPDISPSNYNYSSAYQCQFGSIAFGISNSGGVATGSFNARMTVYHNASLVATFNQTVGSINPLQGTSITFNYVPPTSGAYSFVLDCDVPNAVTEVSEANNSTTTTIYFNACLADLSVYGCGSLDVKPVNPTAGNNITIYATIANSGQTTATGPFNVDFNVAGTHYSYNFVGNILPGASSQVSMAVPAPAYGNNTLTVTADNTNAVVETDDNNNSVSTSLCWDFAPTNSSCGGSAYIYPNQYVGHPVTFSTGLLNYGIYEASHVQVKFEVSGPGLSGWLNLGTVSSYADITCSCPIGLTLPGAFAFPQTGNYSVRITADYANQYSECDESNNIIYVSVYVGDSPDYTILSQYIAPSLLNPDLNQSINIDVTYQNLGNGNIDSSEVYVQMDNTPIDSLRAPGLIGGDFNTVHMTHTWSSNVRGVHVIRAVVDHDHQVVESNEYNNEATRAIIVGKSPNLYFSNFAVSTASPNLNSLLAINASIHNNGYDACTATYQLYYLDNLGAEVLIYQQAVTVDTGATVTLATNWLVTDPRTTIIGRITNGNPVEYDVTDNQATANIGIMLIAANATPANCTSSTGVASVVITGGQPPFSKQWSNGQSGDAINVVPGTYTVVVTDAEGYTATDSVTVTGNAAPVVNATANNAVLCSGGSANLSADGASSYSWMPGNLVGATVTVLPTVSTTYTVTGTSSNGCTATATLLITVNPTPVLSLVSQTNPTSGNNGAITLAATNGSAPYTFSIGASTNTTGVFNGLGAGVHNFNVTDASSCTSSVITVTLVSVGCTNAPLPPVIAGPNAVCGLQTGVYTATTTGAATYAWTVPSGLTITSGVGTSSLHVNIAAGTINGNVTCSATNSCGTSAASSYLVTKKPQTPANITGPTSSCGLSSATYSIPPAFGATSYTWAVPTGMTIVAGSGTTSITVSIGSTFSGGNVTVSAVNNCGFIAGTALNVIGKVAPSAISGPSNVCGTSTAMYTCATVRNATSYYWTLPTAWTIMAGQGTNTVIVSLPTNLHNTSFTGNVIVQAVSACGVSGYRTFVVSYCKSLETPTSNDSVASTYSELYPNPATTEFSIDINSDEDRVVVEEVYDMLGNLVIANRVMVMNGKATLKTSIEELNNGLYFVRLMDTNANVLYTEKLMKE